MRVPGACGPTFRCENVRHNTSKAAVLSWGCSYRVKSMRMGTMRLPARFCIRNAVEKKRVTQRQNHSHRWSTKKQPGGGEVAEGAK